MYSQAEVNQMYQNLLTDGYSPDVAGAFVQGVVEQAKQPAPIDARYEEMLAQWEDQKQLEAYDQAVERVVAMNPDVSAARLHAFVAASDGNFERAVDLERADRAAMLADAGLQRVPQPGPAPIDYSQARAAGHMTAQQELHRRIEEATAMAKGRR
jgi:hypothetical protein